MASASQESEVHFVFGEKFRITIAPTPKGQEMQRIQKTTVGNTQWRQWLPLQVWEARVSQPERCQHCGWIIPVLGAVLYISGGAVLHILRCLPGLYPVDVSSTHPIPPQLWLSKCPRVSGGAKSPRPCENHYSQLKLLGRPCVNH